jgi:hypothetical protein
MRRSMILTLCMATSISTQILEVACSRRVPPTRVGGGGAQSQPARPTEPQVTCTLEGITVNAITGKPAKSVTVRAQARTPGAGMARGANVAYYSAISDGEGRFAIKDLPPGEYRVLADRTGFSSVVYGAKTRGEFGTLISLTAGQRMTGLKLRLRPQAVIAGRVVDENGEPASNARVAASFSRYFRGRRQLTIAGTAVADDLGEYRIFGIEPRRYYVSATPGLSMASRLSEGLVANPQPEKAYVTTYYPGATDPRLAAHVDVAAGSVIQNRNIKLAKMLVVRVRGRVVDTTGAIEPAAQIFLDASGEFAIDTSQRNVSASQGRFEFRGVSAGRYVLTAVSQDAQKPAKGSTAVDVGSENLEEVTITLRPRFDLLGSLSLEGEGRADQLVDQVSLLPMRPTDVGPPGARPDSQGRFALTGVLPERYLLIVLARPGFYIKSIRLGSDDVLGRPLDLTGRESGSLRIVMGANAGEISGMVTDESGGAVQQPRVVLVPESALRLEPSQTFIIDPNNVTLGGPDGSYRFARIAPGNYKLFAWADPSRDDWADPDTVKAVESKGRTVQIQEGSRQILNLRAIPAPEFGDKPGPRNSAQSGFAGDGGMGTGTVGGIGSGIGKALAQ